MTHASDSSSPPVHWLGGVVRPRGFQHDGKPLRLAVWITRAGMTVDVAIVSGKGPVLLRQMFDEQLRRVEASKRPTRVTVWPSVEKAFRDVSFPEVEVRKHGFLKVVVEDQCCFGHWPYDAPVRAA